MTNCSSPYFTFMLLLITLAAFVTARAVDTSTSTYTDVDAAAHTNSNLAPRQMPRVKCEASNASPLVEDARAAADWLLTQPREICKSTNRCTTLRCHGTACISRCASSFEYHQKTVDRYSCTQLADWARQVVEKPECWTTDLLHVGGNMRVREQGILNWTEVNVYTRPV